MFHRNATNFSLFDIRIKSQYKNLILVRGSEYEAPSIFLSGTVVLSIPEGIHVKKISLRLTGEYKLDFLEILCGAKNITNLVREKYLLLDISWDNLLVKSEGEIEFGNYGDFIEPFFPKSHAQTNVNSGKNSSTSISSIVKDLEISANTSESTSLSGRQKPPMQRSQSVPHIGLFKSSASGKSVVKLQSAGCNGTPFADLTPSDATMFYLPKGNYELPYECTLPGNLPESVEGLQVASILYKFEATVERGRFDKRFNTYKHLRIQRTLASDHIGLAESVNIANCWPNKLIYDVTLPTKAIPIGSTVSANVVIIPLVKGLTLNAISANLDQSYSLKGLDGITREDRMKIHHLKTFMGDPSELGLDKWVFDVQVTIPSDLKTVSQDCDLKNEILRIRHKLNISFQIKNQDGHVSELRTSLPITLYVSPNVSIHGRKIDIDHSGKFHIFPNETEKLFSVRDESGVDGDGHEIHANPSSSDLMNFDLIPPPLYEQHKYDRLFDALNPSNNHTPVSYFSSDRSPSPCRSLNTRFDSSITALDSPSQTIDTLLTDSPLVAPTLDVVTQFIQASSKNSSSPRLDVVALSRVPSYGVAVEDLTNEDFDLAPSYERSDEEKNTDAESVSNSSKEKSDSSSDHITIDARHHGLKDMFKTIKKK